jgi:hypothetical protein
MGYGRRSAIDRSQKITIIVDAGLASPADQAPLQLLAVPRDLAYNFATMSQGETSHPTTEQLAALDRGQLDVTELAVVEQHVAACAQCSQRLQELPDESLARLAQQAAEAKTLEPRFSTGQTGLTPEIPPELVNHPRYRVLELLGAGGMGVVFKAEHRLMERLVALKVINRKLIERPGAVDRFRQEVKAAARLAHPNIVTAYDAEQAGDVHFLVMEYVDGTSLERLLRQRGPLPVAEACSLAWQAALGLQHAHERGMVHRDIKPANLLLTGQGRVKLLDFGLARFVSEAAPVSEAADAPPSTHVALAPLPQGVDGLTASGVVIGTPDYIAPEQAAEPRSADIRADIYSLGCTLFHLLTGRPPFAGGTAMQKLIAHVEQPPPLLAEMRPDAPPALSQLVAKMLAKDPSQRSQTPGEAAEALRPWTGRTISPGKFPGERGEQHSADVAVSERGHRARFVAAAIGVALLCLVAVAAALVLRPGAAPATSGLAASSEVGKPTQSIAAASQPGIVVQTQTVPKERPLTVTSRIPNLQKVKIDKDAHRDELVAWMNAHSTLPKPLAADLSRVTKPDDDLYLIAGPALMKSGALTHVAALGDRYFVFELTPEEAKFSRIDDKDFKIDRTPSPKPRRYLIELSALRAVSGKVTADRQLIRFSLTFRLLEPIEGRLCIRTARRVARKNYYNHAELLAPLPGKSGTLEFDTRWSTAVEAKEDGPAFFFVEACLLEAPKKFDTATIVSSTVAVLANISSPKDDGP